VSIENRANAQLVEVFASDCWRPSWRCVPLHDKARDRIYRHEAAFYLGQLYYFGKGMKSDYKRAFDYLLEASRYGEANAQSLLATLYFQGLGALQNNLEAYKWAAIAAANGSEDAVKTRDMAQLRLSPADLESARRQAANRGKGGNVMVYDCKITSEDWLGTDNFTIDLDTWRAKIAPGKYQLDAIVDEDEIKLSADFSSDQYMINRGSGQYTVRFDMGNREHHQYGNCVAVQRSTKQETLGQVGK
jgi:Sel1 repeat